MSCEGDFKSRPQSNSTALPSLLQLPLSNKSRVPWLLLNSAVSTLRHPSLEVDPQQQGFQRRRRPGTYQSKVNSKSWSMAHVIAARMRKNCASTLNSRNHPRRRRQDPIDPQNRLMIVARDDGIMMKEFRHRGKRKPPTPPLWTRKARASRANS